MFWPDLRSPYAFKHESVQRMYEKIEQDNYLSLMRIQLSHRVITVQLKDNNDSDYAAKWKAHDSERRMEEEIKLLAKKFVDDVMGCFELDEELTLKEQTPPAIPSGSLLNELENILGKSIPIAPHSMVALRNCHLVYVWVRGETALYIGKSKNGIGRSLEEDHHALNGQLQNGDELFVFKQKTEMVALYKEKEAIRIFQPILNCVHR